MTEELQVQLEDCTPRNNGESIDRLAEVTMTMSREQFLERLAKVDDATMAKFMAYALKMLSE